mgnify:CR=1 FL=1
MAHSTMFTTQLRRPRAVWWAVLVAVLFAIAPTLSRALNFANPHSGHNFEICSAQKLTTAAPDAVPSATGSPTGQESATTLQHCPFCLHSADRLAPPPSLWPYPLVVAGGPQEMPAWQAVFFRKIHTLWLEPRGPPTRG